MSGGWGVLHSSADERASKDDETTEQTDFFTLMGSCTRTRSRWLLLFIGNSDPDQSAKILHPEFLFPLGKTHTESFVCSLTRMDSSTPHSPPGRTCSSPFEPQICLPLCPHIKERQKRSQQPAGQKTCTACSYPKHHVVHVHCFSSSPVWFQRGQKSEAAGTSSVCSNPTKTLIHTSSQQHFTPSSDHTHIYHWRHVVCL